VRVLPAIVQPASGLLPIGHAEILQGRAVGAQLVRDILRRSAARAGSGRTASPPVG
jgi:hypothetical protein